MKSRIRLLRQMVAFFVIFLLTINFAAVVSDNDGAVFITKAEFDALRVSFQSQIDNYNLSIDSKIDGAIASYLAGIQIATVKDQDPIYNNYSITSNTDSRLYWINSTNGAYCTSNTQRSTIKGKIYSVGYYSTNSGASQTLAIKTLGSATVETTETKVNRVRYINDDNQYISLCQKCCYNGTWVSCNGLWWNSSYQGT